MREKGRRREKGGGGRKGQRKEERVREIGRGRREVMGWWWPVSLLVSFIIICGTLSSPAWAPPVFPGSSAPLIS